MERSVAIGRGVSTGRNGALEWRTTSGVGAEVLPRWAQAGAGDEPALRLDGEPQIDECGWQRGGAERQRDGVEHQPVGGEAHVDGGAGHADGVERQDDWQVVHRALRSIAKRRAGMDAEEARWLREAEALKIWEPLAMVSALDYVERVLGYAPRTAKERLRVARALGGLPRLSAALAEGELAYSAVRELSRVATSATEEDWLAHARGKNLRQIEELVTDHHLGDRPEDPKDPRARMQVVRLELSAETYALFRQARQVLDSEHGTTLSEDQLITQLCNAVLDGGSVSESTGRAKFQVAVTVCEGCQQGWQHGAGAKIAIGAAAVERALCDAQHIGSIDGDAPARAYQDISPSVARFVWHRDAGRCRVPGCRSARGLELHHLVHRADGGGHDASNLALLCSACHLAHHAGTLQIIGNAAHLEVIRPAHVGTASSAAAASSRDPGDPHSRPSAPMAHGVIGTRAHVGADEARNQPGASMGDGVIGTRARGGADDACDEPGGRMGVGATRERARADIAVLDRVAQCADATAALKQAGWAPAVAQAAVRSAAATLGARATLEGLVFEALRRCRGNR